MACAHVMGRPCCECNPCRQFTQADLDAAVAAEREACAKIADRMSDDFPAFDSRGIMAFKIADVIRARGGAK